ncbi:MAG: hypothetical protein OXQ29_19010, partial [Rhodospirillaceae bacterium]|nr:hypothetical protein [Rhodospirillaceae bacterium]
MIEIPPSALRAADCAVQQSAWQARPGSHRSTLAARAQQLCSGARAFGICGAPAGTAAIAVGAATRGGKPMAKFPTVRTPTIEEVL